MSKSFKKVLTDGHFISVTLNADMLWDSEDYNERRQALGSKIAQMLGEKPTSPLLGRIIMGEEESSGEKTVTVASIQQAIKKCSFFSVFGKNNVIVKDGTFDLGENQQTCDFIYPFLENCLQYIKSNSAEEWEKTDDESNLLVINRGIQAIIRIIDDLVIHLMNSEKINPKTLTAKEIAKKLEFYFAPLCDYINSISDSDRKELRSNFGGGGDKRFLMVFRKAIADIRTDFNPDGLSEYWLNKAKQFNEESANFIRDIEITVKQLIQEKLLKMYGNTWLMKGLPKAIYTNSKNEADAKNYDMINGDGYNDGDTNTTMSPWDCISLSDCKEIVTYGTQWKDCFSSILVRPEDVNASGTKQNKTEWLNQISAIKNRLNRSNYSVSSDDFEMIKSVHRWLCKE